jgi:gentisate 1,2-dioxygenase
MIQLQRMGCLAVDIQSLHRLLLPRSLRGGAEDAGYTVSNNRRMKWTQGDTLVLPPWSWHQFGNPTSKEAILFSINDKPILEPHGLYREETKG